MEKKHFNLTDFLAEFNKKRAEENRKEKEQNEAWLQLARIILYAAIFNQRKFKIQDLDLNASLKDRIFYILGGQNQLLHLREIYVVMIFAISPLLIELAKTYGKEWPKEKIIEIDNHFRGPLDTEILSHIRQSLCSLTEEGKVCAFTYKDNTLYGLSSWFSGQGKLKDGEIRERLLEALEPFREI